MAVASFEIDEATHLAAGISDSVDAGNPPDWTSKEETTFRAYMAGEPNIRGRVLHNEITRAHEKCAKGEA